ncbi:helix-turn-helix domain-containing protein [Parafrankia discariae]|uniref:helix-turn-helix domain-containing protein n=1 Tax=Parafrankia discariae TaxID=365528 RepID=UPI0003A8A1B9|nr:helix-turn-helix transcriptional regulator [Parafrankia discariae]
MTNKRGIPPYTARGRVEGEDWQAVADALNARMTRKRMGQQALATASGVSVATLRQLQHGAQGRRVQDATLAAVARALDWPDDHLTRILVHAEEPSETTSGQSEDRAGTPINRQILAVLLRIEQRLTDLSERIAPTDPPRTNSGNDNGPVPTE